MDGSYLLASYGKLGYIASRSVYHLIEVLIQLVGHR
jgi:hypothetical protein